MGVNTVVAVHIHEVGGRVPLRPLNQRLCLATKAFGSINLKSSIGSQTPLSAGLNHRYENAQRILGNNYYRA